MACYTQSGGVFVYSPTTDFSGNDYFSYYQNNNQTTYHVTIAVSFVNDRPRGRGRWALR